MAQGGRGLSSSLSRLKYPEAHRVNAKKFDWTGVHKRISTALAAIAAGSTAAGAAFAVGPAEWRAAFPAELGQWLLGIGIAATFLIPVATSFRQTSLQK